MQLKTITVYIALQHSDGTEPQPESGYSRVCVENVDILDVPTLTEQQIVFNDVVAPGYGLITDICAYDAPKGGELLYTWHLPEPVNAHEGTIPVTYQGKLLLGVDVTAKINLSSADMCEVIKKRRGEMLEEEDTEQANSMASLFNKERTWMIRWMLAAGKPLYLRTMHSGGSWTMGVPLALEDFDMRPEGGYLLNRELVVDELPAGTDVLALGIFHGVTLLRCITYEDLEHSRNTTGCRIVLRPGQLAL